MQAGASAQAVKTAPPTTETIQQVRAPIQTEFGRGIQNSSSFLGSGCVCAAAGGEPALHPGHHGASECRQPSCSRPVRLLSSSKWSGLPWDGTCMPCKNVHANCRSATQSLLMSKIVDYHANFRDQHFCQPVRQHQGLLAHGLQIHAVMAVVIHIAYTLGPPISAPANNFNDFENILELWCQIADRPHPTSHISKMQKLQKHSIVACKHIVAEARYSDSCQMPQVSAAAAAESDVSGSHR